MNEDISELLGVLAHEMRTPIAAILGYQELLSEGIYGSVDERGQEPLSRIAYSARQLLHLIDGVQEIGTAPEKRLNVQTETFEPAPMLRQCLANAGADAVGRNVQLDASIPDALPALTGDPDRLCRAIDLTLAAAIKTSHGATLAVSAAPSGDGLRVAVEGTGLNAEKDAPVLPGGTGGRLSGAGLRLAIVREIARQMHGDLELSPAESGTSVILRFGSGN